MRARETTGKRKKRLLCYGIGNPDRGDDALGPAMLEWLSDHCNTLPLYELILEQPFQLQPEHLYDMANADIILFIDATVDPEAALRFAAVTAKTSQSAFVTHALPPEHLLALHLSIMKEEPPPAYLLTMGADNMKLGNGMSETGMRNMAKAKRLLQDYLQKDRSQWEETNLNAASAVL